MSKNTIENQSKTLMIKGHLAVTKDERGSNYVQFLPDDPGSVMTDSFRGDGFGEMLRNGTFDYITKHHKHSSSVLIRKLRHGRLSKTKDLATQLTIKVFDYEDVDVANVLLEESQEAVESLCGLNTK